MIVVDASVWVSLYLEDDSHHAAADRWFAGAELQRTVLVSPAIVLAETAGALRRRTGNGDMARYVVHAMARLTTVRVVPVDGALGLLAARLAAELRLRGADACYVAVAQELGLPLVSWDDELLARATGAVGVLRPE